MADQIDERILAILRTDARTPVAEISRKIGRSRTAVVARIARLETSGRIVRYTIVERGQDDNNCMGAIILVQMSNRSKTGKFSSLIRTSGWVSACYGISGEFDFAVVLKPLDPDVLERFTKELIDTGEIRHTQTMVKILREF